MDDIGSSSGDIITDQGVLDSDRKFFKLYQEIEPEDIAFLCNLSFLEKNPDKDSRVNKKRVEDDIKSIELYKKIDRLSFIAKEYREKKILSHELVSIRLFQKHSGRFFYHHFNYGNDFPAKLGEAFTILNSYNQFFYRERFSKINLDTIISEQSLLLNDVQSKIKLELEGIISSRKTNKYDDDEKIDDPENPADYLKQKRKYELTSSYSSYDDPEIEISDDILNAVSKYFALLHIGAWEIAKEDIGEDFAYAEFSKCTSIENIEKLISNKKFVNQEALSILRNLFGFGAQTLSFISFATHLQFGINHLKVSENPHHAINHTRKAALEIRNSTNHRKCPVSSLVGSTSDFLIKFIEDESLEKEESKFVTLLRKLKQYLSSGDES